MTKNESNTDRIIRVVAAVLTLVAAFVVGVGSLGGLILLAATAILLLTAAVGFCPLYRVLGINTCTLTTTSVGAGRR